MHKNMAKRNLDRRLKRLRRIMYTAISLCVIEASGIFTLAKTGLLYVQSNAVTNAFAPKTYVDVEIKEPNGDVYYITDEEHNAVNDEGSKEAYITNPGQSSSKKPIVARARIVAVICDSDGVAKGTTQEFTIRNGNTTKDPATEKSWYQSGEYYYYTSVLNPGEESEPIFKDVKLDDIGNIPEGGYVAFHVIVDTVEVDLSGTETAKDNNKTKITDNWKQPEGLWNDILR